MKDADIEKWIKFDYLRKRIPDKEKIKSIIESSTTIMGVIKDMALNEQSATIIFRETYESIRQLGDAKWWLEGYEPRNHEVSITALKEMEIKDKIKLNHLARFKNIRNDANYRGFKVTIDQAKEVIEFWDLCAQEIKERLLKDLENDDKKENKEKNNKKREEDET